MRNNNLTKNLKIVLFLLISLLFVSVVYAACTGEQPPASGDWNINITTNCSNMNLNITGNITVNNSAIFQLSNVTLNMSPTADGSIGIDVTGNAGGMYVYNSTVQSNNTFNFLWVVNSSFEIDRSNISDVGFLAKSILFSI